MPTKVLIQRIARPDKKRVRFDPFVTYLGEEPPPSDSMEESMQMESSRRRGSATDLMSRRGSLQLHEMFSEKGIGDIGDGSLGGFNFGGSFDSLGNSSDVGMGSFLSMGLSEDEEDLTETSGYEAQEVRKKFSRSSFTEFSKSDSSFPDLGPMTLEDEVVLEASSREGVDMGVGRATLTT